MSTPAASTKSVNSTSPEAQNATSKDISSSSPQRTSTTHSTSNSQQQPPTNGDASTVAGQGGEGKQGEGAEGLDEEGYPPQKHAGAIGLGPEYGKMREATASDKIAGLKDELVGKVTRNQDKVQHGHEQRTGELKRKKFEEESSADPFNSADDSNKDPAPAQNTSTGSGAGNSDNSGSSSIPGNEPLASITGKRGAGTHPTEAGAQEQAATTAPEGTEDAERQRTGGNVEGDRQVDEGREGREEGREAKKLRAE